MSEITPDQDIKTLEQELLEIEEQPRYSGLLQSIFPDGTIQYDGVVGEPDEFPLTDAELAEVLSPGEPDPTPPTPNYIVFWEALITSSVYASIREQAMQSLPMNTLATEFIALLGDAKSGRPLPDAIQASILAILNTGTFTEQNLVELGLILHLSNLDSVYSLVP
jgi:hypothetical protein